MPSIHYFRTAEFEPDILDPPVEQSQRTVVVLGLVRGGTSMLGAVLDALGVYMGPKKEVEADATYENFSMRSCDPDERWAEVNRCNAKYDVWGWKNVPGWAFFDGMPSNVRNLHGIFVYRDAYAVVQRRKYSSRQDAGTPVLELLADVVNQYCKLTEVLVQGKLRRMVVSYQRSIQRPETLVYRVCDFLGLKPGLEQVIEAISRVSYGGGYHRKSADDPSLYDERMRKLLEVCSYVVDATLRGQIERCLRDIKQ